MRLFVSTAGASLYSHFRCWEILAILDLLLWDPCFLSKHFNTFQTFKPFNTFLDGLSKFILLSAITAISNFGTNKNEKNYLFSAAPLLYDWFIPSLRICVGLCPILQSRIRWARSKWRQCSTGTSYPHWEFELGVDEGAALGFEVYFTFECLAMFFKNCFGVV